MANHVKFSKGMEVEARREESGFEGFWYTATILRVIPKQDRVSVEYGSLKSESIKSKKVKAVVKLSDVRPRPPVETLLVFKPGDVVDAFYKDGWLEGTIKGSVGDSMFVVYFLRREEEVQFERSTLRHSVDWIDGKWVPKVSEVSEMKFPNGMLVEVCSDEEGFSGAWFTATIVNAYGKNSFVVEYQDLKTDDETELLRETVDSKHIRPIPPDILDVKTYRLLDEVDTWYNDAWWVGVISKILEGTKYVVYFRNTKEEIEFQHSELRLHQEWISGRWIQASQALKLSD